MIWELTNTFRLRVEPMNFILEQYREGGINRRTGEQGKAKWVICGYYSTLQNAIRAIPDEIAQHPEVETFAGFIERLDKLAGQLARRVGHA